MRLQAGDHVRPRRATGRADPEKQAAQSGDDKREQEDASVDVHVSQAWNIGRSERKKSPEREPRDHESEQTAGKAQQTAFSEYLPHDAVWGGADRAANRHLARARGRAH